MITLQPLSGRDDLCHGFFTRSNGVSTGLYASMNCGFGSNDDKDNVRRNRALAMAQLGVPSDALVTCYQVHGTGVMRVGETWAPEDSPIADGMVTNRPGIALGVLTADCAPVLMADLQAGVIGACHAGWRGALNGIAQATVEAMEELGADRRRLTVGIGPCIGASSYEVGPEFPEPFTAQDGDNAAFFRSVGGSGRSSFDLAGYLGHRLALAGVLGVYRCEHDTLTEDDRFFSYRRSCLRGERDYGRCLSAIALTT